MFQEHKFSTPLFVIFSLLVLFVLTVAGFLFFISYNQANNSLDRQAIYQKKLEINKDPYVTRVASLKENLAGPILDGLDPSFGSTKAPITIVQFSDFKCLACFQQEAVIKNLVEKYRGQTRLVWKDYPENNKDSVSYQAAVAGRCAQEQGKFWEYHDLLFANSAKLSKEVFVKLADQLKLNRKLFESCLVDKNIQYFVDGNMMEAEALKISGVPFIYINDKEFLGEVDQAELEKTIDFELNNKGKKAK